MRPTNTLLSAAALAGLVAASPAPQQLDFNAVLTAAANTLTGPPLSAATQLVTVSTAALISSIDAQVSTTATASITGASASAAATSHNSKKRSVEKRAAPNVLNALANLFGINVATSTSKTTSTSATATGTISNAVLQPAATSCAALASTFTDYLSVQYSVSCNSDLTNYGDISHLTVTAFTDCFALCDAISGCSGFSYISNICYFKNTAGAPAAVARSGCDLAIRKSTTSTTTTSSKAASSTAASSSTAAAAASASSSASAATSVTASTTLASSVSSTSSAATACPTTPENGTYCGFINPEDPCAPQPDGYGPPTTPDTVAEFLINPNFTSLISGLPSTVPSSNSSVQYAQTFTNYNASSSATSYLGLHTLTSYSATDCAAWCDNTTSCTAFNLYIERDPSLNPTKNDSTAATVWGYWCPNPSSITNYKCTLWGSNLDNTTATNAGGWREDFNVVITGSAGYDKTNVTVAAAVVDYAAPSNCSSKAVNAGSYWMGSKFISGPYTPNVCGSYCTAQCGINKQAAIAAGLNSYTPCNMFNAYHVHKNGVPLGTYCSMYDTPLDTTWATFQGSWSGSDYYSSRNSWTYARSVQDSGKC